MYGVSYIHTNYTLKKPTSTEHRVDFPGVFWSRLSSILNVTAR